MKMNIWSKRHVFTCLMGLMGGILTPEGSASNEKIVIRRKAATLTLRDGDVFYKTKPKKNSTGQKVHCALYGIHALMTSIKQEVFEIRYVRSSKEKCILKACHVDLHVTSRHMGYFSSRFGAAFFFFWKGVIKDIEKVE